MTTMVHVVTVPQTAAHFLDPVIRGLADWDHHIITGDAGWLPADDLTTRLGIDATIHVVDLERRLTPARDLRALIKVVRLVRTLRPDVVHGHTPKAALVGLLAATIVRVPCRLYTVRGLPLQTATGPTRLALWLAECVTMLCVTNGWVVSHSLLQALHAWRLPRLSRLSVLGDGSGQGTDTARFTADPERRREVRAELGVDDAIVIGFVGRLVRDKGVVELAEIWARLEPRGDVRLLVVGDDNEPRAIVPQHVARLRASDGVTMTGRVAAPERYLDAMDIFFFPSHREGFSNALLEAASMGLPCLGYDVTGVRDGIVDGVTGFLVDFGDVDGLTSRLIQLVGDEDLRRRLGTAGAEWTRAHFRRPEVIGRAVAAIRATQRRTARST